MKDQKKIKKESLSGEFIKQEIQGSDTIVETVITYIIKDDMITYKTKDGVITHSIEEDITRRKNNSDRKYSLVKINLNEAELHSMLTTHSDAGYIIISAFRGDRSLADNYKRHKELERYITSSKSKYSYIPVWGGTVETDEDTKETREVKEKSFIITNFPRGSIKPYPDTMGLREFGLELIKKYDQDTFLFKPIGKSKTAYLIKVNGDITNTFNAVSPAKAADIYFTNLKESRFGDEVGKSFAYKECNLYMAQGPISVSEARARYGESFFNLVDPDISPPIQIDDDPGLLDKGYLEMLKSMNPERVKFLYDIRTDIFMRDIVKTHPRVLFYPSSGFWNNPQFYDLDYDLFILSDYFPLSINESRYSHYRQMERRDRRLKLYKDMKDARIYKHGNKYVIIILQDNNAVFARIKHNGLKLSCFCAVCDGCNEGGNYECINTYKWLSKVIKQANGNELLYVTDHFDRQKPARIRYLKFKDHNFCNVNYSSPESEKIQKVFKGVYGQLGIFRLSPKGEKIQPTYPVPTWSKICKSGIKLSLIYDNIANHIEELDGIFYGSNNNEEVKQIRPDLEYIRFHKINPLRYNPAPITNKILKTSFTHSYNKVGTLSYGSSNYQEIIELCDNWDKDYPKEINIYFVHKNDFDSIKDQFDFELKSY